MNNRFQSLIFLFFLGQLSFAQDTIPVDYETDYLIIENNVYQFFTAEGQALTLEFKTPNCYFPLRIDAETCYLGENEQFEAQVNGKWGLMTRQGEVKLPFEYDEILTSYDGRIFVREKKKWIEIEYAVGGNRVFPIDCDFVTVDYQIGVLFIKGDSVFFSPEKGIVSEKPAKLPTYGYFEIRRGCKSGVGTTDGKLLLPLAYSDINISDEGITLSDGGKQGFYHPETAQMIPVKYDAIDDGSNDGLLIYEMGPKKGLMRVNGEILTEPIYQSLYAWGDVIIKVKINNKWGFIDTNGREQIPCIYEDVDSFKNGLAGAKMDGKWGFINEKGEVEIPFQFEGGHMGLYFREYERAKIKEGGSCFYINRKGERLEDCSCR